MSHTSFRYGDIETLQNDICVMAHPQKGANFEGSRPFLQWFFATANMCGAVNMGSIVTGNMVEHSAEEIIANIKDGRGTFVVFDDRNKAEKFVDLVAKMDGPVSVVITALWDLVLPICEKAGIKPHSVNRAVGIYGKTEYLAPEEIRQYTTMCGHGLVSRHLVDKILKDVEKGKISPRAAALKMAKPCMCGFFNISRAEELIEGHCAHACEQKTNI